MYFYVHGCNQGHMAFMLKKIKWTWIHSCELEKVASSSITTIFFASQVSHVLFSNYVQDPWWKVILLKATRFWIKFGLNVDHVEPMGLVANTMENNGQHVNIRSDEGQLSSFHATAMDEDRSELLDLFQKLNNFRWGPWL